MCGVTKRFQYWGQQDSKQKLQFYPGFKSVILQMSEPDEGQEGWECGTIARVRLERWKDCEELWDKVVLLCNSLRYLSTMLVFYVLHQEIAPCVTDINPAPIIIRSHNTLKRHIYWHSWQFLSPGDATGSSRNPYKDKTGFSCHGHERWSLTNLKSSSYTQNGKTATISVPQDAWRKNNNLSVKFEIESCRHFHQKPLK